MRKRPIDIKREGAFSIRVGSDDDQSPLTDFYTICDKLMLLVKENAIYKVKLADDIDPERTNFDLEPTQSRVLAVGSADPIVQRILFTAKTMFRQPGHLGSQFDYAMARDVSFEILMHLIFIRTTYVELDEAQNSAWKKYQAEQQGRGAISMPSLPDVGFRGNAFFQKCGNLLGLIENLARLFYPEITSKWLDSLEKLAIANGDKSAPLAQLIKENKSFLTRLRNARNSVEHESASQRLEIEDFSMNAGREIIAPQFRLIHPNTPIERSGLAVTMNQVAADMVGICELFLGFLCAAKAESSFAGCSLSVAPVAEEMRGRTSSFEYVILVEGQWRVLG